MVAAPQDFQLDCESLGSLQDGSFRLSRHFKLSLAHLQLEAVDALSSPWMCKLAYAFHPWPPIARFLSRIMTETIIVVAVLPYLQRRSWFPLAMYLNVCPPARVPLIPRLLSQGELTHMTLTGLIFTNVHLGKEDRI